MTLSRYEVWLCDFEYSHEPGERPVVVCMVAREFRTERTMRLWADELQALPEAPFNTGPRALFVAYNAVAELTCFLVLGWPLPINVLDLYVEYRLYTNGRRAGGCGLLDALALHGIRTEGLSAIKSEMHKLIGEGLFSTDDHERILDYCESDVIALAELLPKMLPTIDVDQALLRGAYMKAASRMQYRGVPLDANTFHDLRETWGHLRHALVDEVQDDYDLGLWNHGSFSEAAFQLWTEDNGIPWPRLLSGRLELQDGTFRSMAARYPEVAPIRELRAALAQLRLLDWEVGSDGRNRASLWPFSTVTGRNAPSSSKFVFGASSWTRYLVQAPPGRALAYVDFSSQEFAVAAALSGDARMAEVYHSADPYVAYAKLAGAVPADATRHTHARERGIYKVLALATLYGAGSRSIALKAGVSIGGAEGLLAQHRRLFPRLWHWLEGAVDHYQVLGYLHTVFGWRRYMSGELNPRSVMNFPCQANGAEITRLACVLATEAGIEVCAPVHDALLVEADESEVEGVVRETRRLMGEAARTVLGGFEVRTDAKVFMSGERFHDGNRGREMWNRVRGLLRRELGGTGFPFGDAA